MQQIKNLYHLLQAFIACLLYGFPSKRLKVIGVTGTDGKTTTTHLIYHILKSAGKKVSMVSTVYAKIGDKEYETGLHVTTPGAFLIQKLLKKAADEGSEYFVLETTSHALDQNRVWGVTFLVSVITNITHEHLDYHGTFDNYLKAKARLLLSSQESLINKDDGSYTKLKSVLDENQKKYSTYALKAKADFNFDYRTIDKNLPLFNAYNYLAAVSVASKVGIDEKKSVSSLKNFILPKGRIEVLEHNGVTVVIDFAHTPNAFEQLLPELKRSVKKGGKLIHVFGSAAKRDVTKRPLMGAASSKYADYIILTEEDYRDEDPEEICRQIAEGIKTEYVVITDRETAISQALQIAKRGDTVVITGKGHEKSLARNGKEYPWDERAVVEKSFKEHDTAR